MTNAEYERKLLQFDVGVAHLMLKIHDVGGMYENEIKGALTALAAETGFDIDLEEPESFISITEDAYMRLVERGMLEMPPIVQ